MCAKKIIKCIFISCIITILRSELNTFHDIVDIRLATSRALDCEFILLGILFIMHGFEYFRIYSAYYMHLIHRSDKTHVHSENCYWLNFVYAFKLL